MKIEIKKQLVLEYASLAIKKIKKGLSEKDFKRFQEIKKKLGLSHQEIIKAAEGLTVK